jgi:hypothetical protein
MIRPALAGFLIVASGAKIERTLPYWMKCMSNSAESLSPSEKEANITGLSIKEFQNVGMLPAPFS